jgi:hypothetical protein
MAEKTTPIVHDPSDAVASAATSPDPAPSTRRTVTMPVLPLAIIGAVVVALIFFGGGIAVGFAIGDHPARVGVIQPFGPGRNGTQGGQNGLGQNGFGQNGFGQNGFGQNGFGQNRGPNGGQNGQGNGTPPNDPPTTAPKNG